MPENKSLTRPQLAAYWRAASAAAREVGEPLEAYRKRVMREECGAASVKALNRTGDFDKVMCRFAVDARDYKMAAKFATAAAERLAVMVRVCCLQIMQLKGEPQGSAASIDYIAAILRQAHQPLGASADGFWLDIPQDSALALFRMLDTHRRRLLSRLAAQSSIRPWMGFEMNVVYRPKPHGVQLFYDPQHYTADNSLTVNVTRA